MTKIILPGVKELVEFRGIKKCVEKAILDNYFSKLRQLNVTQDGLAHA